MSVAVIEKFFEKEGTGMFLNLAHRGASAYAPENTLPAFYKGIECGANGIETDIQMSRDGELFLFHDKKLDRTTSGSGSPAELSWTELAELDAGSWFSPAYAGERLVTLEMFLYLFGRKELQLALELKADGIEQPVLQMVEAFGVREKTTITAFSFDSLVKVRELDSTVRIGYLINKIDEPIISDLKSLGASQICPKASELTKQEVDLAHAHGLTVRAWGTQTVELMKHVLECGVDGTTINFPDRLNEALRLESIG
jgi:glycerophosphoryl diester phosphodiesterase